MKSKIYIFCDGACSGNPGPGGWGALLIFSNQVMELGGFNSQTTNNQMELSAALEALKKLEKIDGEIELYSDSKYFKQGIEKWVYGWRRNGWKTAEGSPVKNKELWEQLFELKEKILKKSTLSFHYVPGHAGHVANERVDSIAVAFARNEPVSLYHGSAENYPHFSIEKLLLNPLQTDLNEKGIVSVSSSYPVYLSYQAGQLKRFLKWADCEKEVKGKAGVKFKKVKNQFEEQQIMKDWGIHL